MKITTCLFSILLLPSCLLGQNSFIEHKINQPLTFIEDVRSADLDNDGDIDIAAISSFDNSFVWYENDGDENFTSHFTQLSSINDYEGKLSLHDLDDDGDIDIIMSRNSNSVEWMMNDGSGNFGTPISISSASISGEKLYIVDMDNDDDQDILYGNNLLLNDGNENFTLNVLSVITSSIGNASTTIVDFDQDGLLDLLATERYNGIAWYKQETDGTFTENWIIENPTTYYVESIAGDIDDDGDMDVIVTYTASTSGGGTAIKVLHNSGDDIIFTTTNLYEPGEVHNLLLVDIDEDDDLDLITRITDTYEGEETGIRLFLNTTGSFDTSFNRKLPNSNKWSDNWGSGGETFHLSDVNSDGKLDIVSAKRNFGRITYYENEIVDESIDGITFSHKEVSNSAGDDAIGDIAHGNLPLATGDFNNDEYLDVICAASGDNQLEFHKGTGNNITFNKTSILNNDLNFVKAVNLNGDENLDIVWSSQTLNTDSTYSIFVGALFGNGNGTFTTNSIYTYQAGASFSLNINVTDVDNDEDLDVLILKNDEIILAVNDGIGSFITSTAYTISNNVIVSGFPTELIDIDGDTLIDIPVTRSMGGTYTSTAYAYLKGNGSTFTLQNNFANLSGNEIQSYSSSVMIANDIDSDGDIDFISNGASLINNGADLYEVRTDIIGDPFSVGTKTNLKIADIDNDGDKDIIALYNNVILFENDNMTFTSTTISEGTNDHSFEFEVLDFDNDGDLDILYSSVFAHKIAWIENNTETLSIEDNTKEETLELLYYPNPVKDALTLKSNILFDNYKVLDYSGKLVKKGEVKNSQLSLSNLTPGLYLIQLYNEGNITTLKIVKE